MSKISHKEEQIVNIIHNPFTYPSIGRIAPPGNSGDVMVVVKGLGARAARLISTVSREDLVKPDSVGREVLLVFEEGDPERPVIVGLIENRLEEIVLLPAVQSPPLQGKGQTCTEQSRRGDDELNETVIDGKRVTLEASEEIVLKCGRGSITLRKDGKIIIKGTHLFSRSSGPIRVKGARVDIN